MLRRKLSSSVRHLQSSSLKCLCFEAEFLKSVANPKVFWATEADTLNWSREYNSLVTGDFSRGDIRWMTGGKLNASLNCIDRWTEYGHGQLRGQGRGDDLAIVWEGEDKSQTRSITYNELQRDVSKIANVMKARGVRRGDAVTIFMGTVPEKAMAMLACSRIGAVHCVVSSVHDTSPSALAEQISASQSRFICTTDEGRRDGQRVPMKETVDRALDEMDAFGGSVRHRPRGGPDTSDDPARQLTADTVFVFRRLPAPENAAKEGGEEQGVCEYSYCPSPNDTALPWFKHWQQRVLQQNTEEALLQDGNITPASSDELFRDIIGEANDLTRSSVTGIFEAIREHEQRPNHQSIITMFQGRDLDMSEAVREARPYCPAEDMDSEDPLCVVFAAAPQTTATATATAPLRGLVHSTAGFLTYAAATTREVFKGRPAAEESEVDPFSDREVVEAMRRSRTPTTCYTAADDGELQELRESHQSQQLHPLDSQQQQQQQQPQPQPQQRQPQQSQQSQPHWPEGVKTSEASGGAWRHHSEETLPRLSEKERREMEVAEVAALFGDSTLGLYDQLKAIHEVRAHTFGSTPAFADAAEQAAVVDKADAAGSELEGEREAQSQTPQQPPPPKQPPQHQPRQPLRQPQNVMPTTSAAVGKNPPPPWTFAHPWATDVVRFPWTESPPTAAQESGAAAAASGSEEEKKREMLEKVGVETRVQNAAASAAVLASPAAAAVLATRFVSHPLLVAGAIEASAAAIAAFNTANAAAKSASASVNEQEAEAAAAMVRGATVAAVVAGSLAMPMVGGLAARRAALPLMAATAVEAAVMSSAALVAMKYGNRPAHTAESGGDTMAWSRTPIPVTDILPEPFIDFAAYGQEVAAAKTKKEEKGNAEKKDRPLTAEEMVSVGDAAAFGAVLALPAALAVLVSGALPNAALIAAAIEAAAASAAALATAEHISVSPSAEDSTTETMHTGAEAAMISAAITLPVIVAAVTSGMGLPLAAGAAIEASIMSAAALGAMVQGHRPNPSNIHVNDVLEYAVLGIETAKKQKEEEYGTLTEKQQEERRKQAAAADKRFAEMLAYKRADAAQSYTTNLRYAESLAAQSDAQLVETEKATARYVAAVKKSEHRGGKTHAQKPSWESDGKPEMVGVEVWPSPSAPTAHRAEMESGWRAHLASVAHGHRAAPKTAVEHVATALHQTTLKHQAKLQRDMLTEHEKYTLLKAAAEAAADGAAAAGKAANTYRIADALELMEAESELDREAAKRQWSTHTDAWNRRKETLLFFDEDLGSTAGIAYGVYGPLLNGWTTVLVEDVGNGNDEQQQQGRNRVWDIVQRRKVTQMLTGPVVLRRLMQRAESEGEGEGVASRTYDTSSLATVASVHEGAFDAREGWVEWAWLQRRFGSVSSNCNGSTSNLLRFTDAYCFAEAGGILFTDRYLADTANTLITAAAAPASASAATASAAAESKAELAKHRGTKAVRGIDLLIADPVTGAPVPDGTRGLLCVGANWPGLARTVLSSHSAFVHRYFRTLPGYFSSGLLAVREPHSASITVMFAADNAAVGKAAVGNAEDVALGDAAAYKGAAEASAETGWSAVTETPSDAKCHEGPETASRDKNKTNTGGREGAKEREQDRARGGGKRDDNTANNSNKSRRRRSGSSLTDA